MLRAKDSKDLDIRYINPTDEQPNVHPQFFEITAEEQAEQERIKVREMSLIDPTEYVSVKDEMREYFVDEFPFFDKRMTSDDYLQTLNPDIQEILARARNFARAVRPTFCILNTKEIQEYEKLDLVLEPIGKVGLSRKDLIQDLNLLGQPIRSSRPSLYQHWITQMLLERTKEHIANNPPKEKQKAKADYKRKFYKNTAKQEKPSPMLMSLVGKTK